MFGRFEVYFQIDFCDFVLLVRLGNLLESRAAGLMIEVELRSLNHVTYLFLMLRKRESHVKV
jgi:hypothetical protein